jgi:conjugative transfer region protein TrbK
VIAAVAVLAGSIRSGRSDAPASVAPAGLRDGLWDCREAQAGDGACRAVWREARERFLGLRP